MQQLYPGSCAACGKQITDKYILKALDRTWHCSCLVCSICQRVLTELGPSLFVKGDLVLCRQDYIRFFGSGGQCSRCLRGIASHESVMKARDLVFHIDCFACARCGRRLQTGDRFLLEHNHPVCEASLFDHSHCAPQSQQPPLRLPIRLENARAAPESLLQSADHPIAYQVALKYENAAKF